VRGRAVIAAAVALLVSAAGGCSTLVTVYEPQGGLRLPTRVERQAAPLSSTRVALRCLEMATSDPLARLLAANETREICTRVSRALQQAGALVTTVTNPQAEAATDPYDLYVDWQVRLEHEASSPWMAAASCLSCSLVPTIEQRTYVHRAVIRGRDRGVLHTHESRARFVDYDGCGIWLVTWLLDFLRADEDKVGDPAARRRYSRDVYRQLTQSLVNARARSDLLGLTPRRVDPAAVARLAPGGTTAPMTPAPATTAPTTTTPAPTTTTAPTTTAPTTTAPTTTTPTMTTPATTAPTTTAPTTTAPTTTTPATTTPATTTTPTPADPSDAGRR
jgi:hypothetical protein